MNHAFLKNPEDANHDIYEIMPQGQADEAKFGRIFDRPDDRTLRLTHKILTKRDGDVMRKVIHVWMRRLTLAEIAAESHDFADLSPIELHELASRHDESVGVKEREQVIAALLDIAKKQAASAPVQPVADRPLVIPKSIRDMDAKDLVTKAFTLGIQTKASGGKPLERSVLEERIVKKMSANEPAIA